VEESRRLQSGKVTKRRVFCIWAKSTTAGGVARKVRESVEVKLFSREGELYVLAKSEGRQAKEIAIHGNMRR
jgi:hypothetical protein